ncbi:MAG: Na+/H+ antiporter subunit E [Candidatus Binatia bacterium]
MKTNSTESYSRFNPAAFFAAFGILLALWLVLSGHFDLFHVSLGVICTALVAFLNHDLLFPDLKWGRSIAVFFRFLGYIPWLFYQIILANLHVAKMVLHPRMPIDPRIIQFDTKLERNLSMTTLGNSITLTPGTITVDIRDGRYFIHALTEKAADDLLSGEMENRVAAIYREGDGQEGEREN